jgi:hypothetical protein
MTASRTTAYTLRERSAETRESQWESIEYLRTEDLLPAARLLGEAYEAISGPKGQGLSRASEGIEERRSQLDVSLSMASPNLTRGLLDKFHSNALHMHREYILEYCS